MGRRLSDTLTGIEFIATRFGGDGVTGDPALVQLLAPHRATLAQAATDLTAMVATFVTPPTPGPGAGSP